MCWPHASSAGRAPHQALVQKLGEHLPALRPGQIDETPVPNLFFLEALDDYYAARYADALAPAIRIADEGFPVTPNIAQDWAGTVTGLSRDPGASATFLIDGEAPKPGDWFRNPDLARTFRRTFSSTTTRIGDSIAVPHTSPMPWTAWVSPMENRPPVTKTGK